jgi:transcriptional regulator with XRE-family HTH domain
MLEIGERKMGRSRRETKEDTKRYNLYVGNNLKTIRLQRGISQSKLGEMIGVSGWQISKYENGKNSIKVADLCAISNKLGVLIDNFFRAFIKGE